jgi:outer membrane receptor protein involved in Fe transport
MRSLSYAFLTSASFAALAVATPANAQTPDPVNPDRDPCQAPADQRDPKANCPAADTPAGEAIQQGAVATPAGEEGGVVVVGSRIRRDRFNTADPVTIINRQAAVDAGFNSTAEVLQSVGVTGGTGQINDTFGGLVVEGGPGVNTLSLRGLGPTRTLILLNGRRIAPAGTRGQVGAADLNVLPNAILDRIEVLNTGASSIYGSDAVAGVVNIVTLSKFNGLAVEAAVTAPEIGAGTTQRYAITAGTSGERFSVLGSIELFDRNRITQADAPWARCPQQRRLSPLGANDTDKCWPLEEGGVTVNTIGTGFFLNPATFTGFQNPDPADLAPGFETIPPDYYLLCNRFRPNPTAGGHGAAPAGFECVGGLLYNYITQSGFGTSLNLRDTFAPSMLQQDIISPNRNYTGFLTGTYDTDFFGNGQLYVELLATRRKSQQNGQRQFTLDYPVNSPLLLTANGGMFATIPPRVSTASNIGVRVFADYGIYDSHQTQDFVKMSGGFRGDLPFLPTWRYDLYAAKSWSDGTYSFEQILEDRYQQSLNVRLVSASGATLPAGSTIANTPGAHFVCVDPSGGCVAAPAISAGVIGGQSRTLAPAWFDYITDDVVGHTAFREWTANLTLDGPLFRLPGGDAQAVVGFEYRKSSINDVPSDDSIRNNLHGFSSAPITKGSDNVWEAFTELEFPILKNVPFAEALTLNASGRYTDYKSYGSDTTYKIGGLYSPTRWLSFRGSYGTSYRAPALFEQFLGSTTGFLNQTTDPCNNLFDVTNTTIRANCQAQGLPNNFVQNNSVTVIQRGGAEAGLEAETSKNLTFGGVLQPTLGPDFGNLSLAVDYFRVEVNNGVSQLGAGTIARGCYNGSHPEYCQFVSRAPFTGPGSGALTITQTYINVATDIVKGIDFVLRYDRELGPGKLDIGVQAVKILDRVNQTDPDSEAVDYAGSIGNPKWAGTAHVGYDWGSWYARWGVDYIKGTNDRFLTEDLGFDPAVYDFSVDDYWLHTASLRFEPSNRYSLTLGIRNVFDKKPPKITAEDPFVNTISNVPLQGNFDVRGRTFFVNAQAKIF